MKALFVCMEKDKWDLFNNLFNAHFSRIVLRLASTIPEAIETVTNETDLSPIIIDANVNFDVLELMVAINDLVGERPLIFFGSQSKLKQRITDDMFNSHPDNAFIYHPVNKDQFIEAVSASVDWKKKENFEDSLVELSLDDFLPMKIKNFYYFDQFPYDVFLQITSRKFVKFLAKNTKYSHSLVQSYVKKKVKYFYVAKEDQLKFLEESILNLSKALNKKSAPIHQMINTQIFSASIVHQYVRVVGVSETLVMFVKILMESMFNVFKRTQKLTSILNEYKIKDDTIGFGSLAVLTAYTADVILHKMGWNSSMTRQKMYLASFLADCTLTNDDFVKLKFRSIDDLQMFEESDKNMFLIHPQEAATIATRFTKIPDTDFIILQHQELPDGKGFPNGLLPHKITEISCIFILANQFASEVLNNGYDLNKARAIVKELEETHSISNFKNAYKALELIFKQGL